MTFFHRENGRRRERLLHEQEIARLFDDAGNVALLEGGEPGDAPRKNLARVGDEAGQDFRIGRGQIQRIFLAWFLSAHKGWDAMFWRLAWQEKISYPRKRGSFRHWS